MKLKVSSEELALIHGALISEAIALRRRYRSAQDPKEKEHIKGYCDKYFSLASELTDRVDWSDEE